MHKLQYVSLLIALTFASGLPAQQATVQEEKQVIKTYPFSGPDPAPIMTRSSMWGSGPSLYPYYFFDELSYEGVNQDWNVVRMENPYIRVLVLPSEGGKILGAIEKSTNKEFLYYNKVRKYRHIALRGPWTSGGIEFNFGLIGHAPTTASPVDYLIRKNPDGSVSCIVGTMDLESRTQWRINVTLPPDKAYFETKALWYNPQPLDQSYYVWMNAANRLSKDLEFILPGTAYIGHNYAVPKEPWPVTSDGRDLSLYKNHSDRDEGSFFVHGMLTDSNGAYWHDAKFGYGHWALHEEVPGQKFFRWPLAREGGIWEGLLTDSDGPYFEPQTGRLLDQNDHEFFAPYTTDQWREVWFPYKEIGPMVTATPYGALNARNTGKEIELGFSALQKIDEDLVVYNADKEIFRERLHLAPMGVYERKLTAAVRKGALRVKLGNLMSYSDDPNAKVLKRPLNFRNYDKSTLEGLYQSAERDEKGRNYSAALQKYLECLKRDPTHLRALTRIAALYCRRAEYPKAREYARKALDFAMYDADANYIYGVIARHLSDFVDAKETFGWAARSMKYRSSAYCQIGEIYLMEGNLEQAEDYLKRSLEYDANNVKTHQVLSTLYRRAGKAEKARPVLSRILDIDPLNHLARFESYLLKPGPDTLEAFRSMIRNEMPHETYLEIAMHYVNLGLEDDALRVLEIAPDQATVRYWQAYLLRERSPEQSRKALQKAAALSPYLVFPFREESVPVFQWADKAMAADWKPKYYLGLIYWGLRRNEDAQKLFAELGDRPDYAAFYICRAYLEQGNNPTQAQADYERARTVDPKDWRNWYHLASYYTEKGLREKALAVAVAATKNFPNEDLIKISLARAYLNSGRYLDGYSVLEHATILPFEGQSDVHDLFVQCQVALALELMKKGQYGQAAERLEGAKTYPERLGTGKPADPDFRVQDYLLMLCYKQLGAGSKAAAMKTAIDEYTTRNYKEGLGKLQGKLDQWYASEFSNKDELASLKKLAAVIRGTGPGHE